MSSIQSCLEWRPHKIISCVLKGSHMGEARVRWETHYFHIVSCVPIMYQVSRNAFWCSKGTDFSLKELKYSVSRKSKKQYSVYVPETEGKERKMIFTKSCCCFSATCGFRALIYYLTRQAVRLFLQMCLFSDSSPLCSINLIIQKRTPRITWLLVPIFKGNHLWH